MIIKALIDYRDLQREVDVKVGDEYEVSEERGKQIIDAGYAIELARVEVNHDTQDTEKTAEKAAVIVSDAKDGGQLTPKQKRARRAKKAE